MTNSVYLPRRRVSPAIAKKPSSLRKDGYEVIGSRLKRFERWRTRIEEARHEASRYIDLTKEPVTITQAPTPPTETELTLDGVLGYVPASRLREQFSPGADQYPQDTLRSIGAIAVNPKVRELQEAFAA